MEGSEISEKSSSSGTSRMMTSCQEPPRAKYPTTKDYEKPVYPSPRDFVKPTYPSPSKLERMGASEEGKVARPPPFAPVSPVAPVSPAPGSGQFAESQRSADVTAPLPSSASKGCAVIACPCQSYQAVGECCSGHARYAGDLNSCSHGGACAVVSAVGKRANRSGRSRAACERPEHSTGGWPRHVGGPPRLQTARPCGHSLPHL